MSGGNPGLEGFLARAAQRRVEAGLVRELTLPDPALLDLAGNDYLGLRRHPAVVAGAVEAARAYGGGAGASRLVTGHLPVHAEVEAALAAWTGAESGLLFSTGYHANLAVLTALAGEGDVIVSDAHAHASLIDGARLSRARVEVARHNDVEHVAHLVERAAPARAVIVVESIYSVLGDAAPLADLVEVARRVDATVVVDEAHALGVIGSRGQGAVAAAGLSGDPRVVVTGTLSKALAAQGGIVLASTQVREHLVNAARPFIYDTGVAPAAAGAVLGALRALAADPGLPARVRANSAALARACGVPPVPGAVLSVPMAGPEEALAVVARAGRAGLRIGCFRPPSTPDGISRLRLTAHADHVGEQLAHATRVLSDLVGGAAVEAPAPVERPARVLHIAGTNTDIGKTVAAAAVVAAATAAGQRVAYVKPAQTGLAPEEAGSDADEVRRLVGDVETHEFVRLPEPLAPAAAARRAGVTPPGVGELAGRVVALARRGDLDLVVVEGAGGLLVQLDAAGGTQADLARAVRDAGVPGAFVVVADPALGTLNLCALTAEALAARGLDCAGFVFGSWPVQPGLAEVENVADLPAVTGAPLLGRVPAGAGRFSAAEFTAAAPGWVTLPGPGQAPVPDAQVR